MKYLSAREFAALGLTAALTAGSWTTYALGVGRDSAPTASAPVVAIPVAPVEPRVKFKVTQPPATVSKPVNVDRILTEASTLTPSGIPTAALKAYQNATRWANVNLGCQMTWQVLGGIGLVESNHGRAQHNKLTVQGISIPGIFGPALNGQNGFALIHDGAGFARAEGPMQFIPSTWAVVARSATGKKPDPQNINDAALSAAAYLCHGGRRLSSAAGLLSAIFSYNHSNNYVNAVLAVMRAYGASNVPAALPPDPSPSASASASASATASATATASAKPKPKTTKSPTPTTAAGTGATGAGSGGTTTSGGVGSSKPTSASTPTQAPSPTPSKAPCTNLLGLLCPP